VELNEEALRLISVQDSPSPNTITEDSILVLDLEACGIREAQNWLETCRSDLNATCLLAATAAQLGEISDILDRDDIDAILVEKPAGLSGDDLRRFLHGRLSKSYPRLPPAERNTEAPTPRSGDIDPAYQKPPFGFTDAEHAALIEHLQTPESEVRRQSYPSR
jgi:hypothetical protein